MQCYKNNVLYRHYKSELFRVKLLTISNHDSKPYILLLNKNIHILNNVISNTYIRLRNNLNNVTHIDNLKLNDDDIIFIDENNDIIKVYDSNSYHNSIFITDNCNCNCIMCSQPPMKSNLSSFYYDINNELIDILPKDIRVLGITGGEPTLLGSRLIKLLKKIKISLPNTSVHLLTNGILLSSLSYSNRIVQLGNDIIYGIPIHSDYHKMHDKITNYHNSFNRTIQGIYNLAYSNQRIELRIIIQALNYKRLLNLSKFIYKNLPFVEHITFMGIEYFGNALVNSEMIWVKPILYKEYLKESIEFLVSNNFNVSIYNIPFCLLDVSLWSYCRDSITENKKYFFNKCNACTMMTKCSGIFISNQYILENDIIPL